MILCALKFSKLIDWSVDSYNNASIILIDKCLHTPINHTQLLCWHNLPTHSCSMQQYNTYSCYIHTRLTSHIPHHLWYALCMPLWCTLILILILLPIILWYGRQWLYVVTLVNHPQDVRKYIIILLSWLHKLKNDHFTSSVTCTM